jgi:hypothetical protein
MQLVDIHKKQQDVNNAYHKLIPKHSDSSWGVYDNGKEKGIAKQPGDSTENKSFQREITTKKGC